MDKERILGVLRAHQPELRAAGIVHLRLFGSVARGESTSESDIDLLAEFDPSKLLTLQALAKVEYEFDDLLGIKVDLSSIDSIYPRIRARALAEAVVAFDDPELYFQHVLASIAHIEEFTSGMTLAAYQADQRTKSATERQVQILSEAASRLGDRAQTLAPGVDWRSIRGMGNRLRHGDDSINDEVIWNTIHHDLPPLKTAVSEALCRTADGGKIK